MGQIRIHELELDCIVGIRPDERVRPQRLRVDVEVEVDTAQAARTGRILSTVDWNLAAEELSSLLQFRNYRLLEVAAEELTAMLLGSHPAAQSVSLRLEKPGALEGRARAASVQIFRSRSDYGLTAAGAYGNSSMLITKTCDAELHLCIIAPGERAPAPLGPELRAKSWLLLGQLQSASQEDRSAGTLQDCEGELWRNEQTTPALLFRCAVFHDSLGH